MNVQADFLFAESSFLEGWARVLDFGDTLNEYNSVPTPEMADGIAMWLDWAVTGNDIAYALVEFGEEHEQREALTTVGQGAS